MWVCVDVSVCLKDEIHFEWWKKCHQMEYKHIFTTQSVGHHFGHFCWRTMWWYNSITIIQERRTTTMTTVIRISCDILYAATLFPIPNRSTHLWNFRTFWMRKDFTEMVFIFASNEGSENRFYYYLLCVVEKMVRSFVNTICFVDNRKNNTNKQINNNKKRRNTYYFNPSFSIDKIQSSALVCSFASNAIFLVPFVFVAHIYIHL